MWGEYCVGDSVGQSAQGRLCKSRQKISVGSTLHLHYAYSSLVHVSGIDLLKHKDVDIPCRSDKAKDRNTITDLGSFASTTSKWVTAKRVKCQLQLHTRVGVPDFDRH